MTFLSGLPRRLKEKATDIYQEAFEKNRETMQPRIAHREARSILQKFVSEEFARRRDR